MGVFDLNVGEITVGTDFAGKKIVLKQLFSQEFLTIDKVKNPSHNVAFRDLCSKQNITSEHVTFAKAVNLLFNKSRNLIPANVKDERLATIESFDRIIIQAGLRSLEGTFMSKIIPDGGGGIMNTMAMPALLESFANISPSFANISPEGIMYLTDNNDTLVIEHSYPWCTPIQRTFQSESLKPLTDYKVFKGKIWVGRGSIYSLLCDLASDLADEHEQGRIHGDLKPSNLLLLDKGLVAIDWLNYEKGQLAPFSSKRWTAPEAYMGQPISQSMDVYSMAKLFVKILPGTEYGKQSSFRSPVGGSDSQVYTFYEEPGVFLDFTIDWADICHVTPKDKTKLTETLQKSLSFNPIQRPTMRELANVCKASLELISPSDTDNPKDFTIMVGEGKEHIVYI